jgi:hypothetical protein
MELTIFSMLSLIITRAIDCYTPLHQNIVIGISIVALFLYKSKAIQRLERVLERTEEVRRVKVMERYQNQYSH